MPIVTPATNLALHKTMCSKYECGCLAPNATIQMGDAVFLDRATALLDGTKSGTEEFVGKSISCVANDSTDCVTVEYIEADLTTEFSLPFDVAAFVPTGVQYFDLSTTYPTTILSGSAAVAPAGMDVILTGITTRNGKTYGTFKKNFNF